MRLLVAEDDRELSQRLREGLVQAGFAVDVADNGIDAEHLGNTEPYDAVVLDLGLPGRAGLEVLRRWRAGGNAVPVIVLTARGAWHEKVDGFRAGADDYLAKPFHLEELSARLGAIIRRRHGESPGRLSCGDVMLDEEHQTATRGEHRCALTGTEFRLLRYFMQNPGKTLSKETLAGHVYDYAAEHDSNVLEVYVRRLREKLGADLIRTRRGQGYVFEVRR